MTLATDLRSSQSGYLTRRQLVCASAAGGLSLLARGTPTGGSGRSTGTSLSKKSALPLPATATGGLRFAHLTDPHVYTDPRAIPGFAAAVTSIDNLRPACQFIITGGDHVMDTFVSNRREADKQWDLYLDLLMRNTSLPTFAVLGNHDIWGWGDARISERDAGYGKKLALDRLALDRSYYSFDAGGWHFICLDNVARRGQGFYGTLDAAQGEWLRADLAGVGSAVPVCVVSHLPLLSACAFFDTGVGSSNGYAVSDTSMHHDVKGLLDLLGQYNVRLCLSGHLHMVDRVEYRGITFICDGAVCGNWWQGPYQGHAPGYGIIDIWADGSFQHQYVRTR